MKPSYILTCLVLFYAGVVEVDGAEPFFGIESRDQTESGKSAEQQSVTADQRFAIVEEQPGLVITVDKSLFAKYVVNDVNKPYLWPIIGPTGKAMTRAYPMQLVGNENKTQRDHPHHRGLLFGHESAGLDGWTFPESEADWNKILPKKRNVVGGDTWHEKATFDEYMKMSRLAEDGKKRQATLAAIKHRKFTKLDANDDRAIVIQICDHVDRDTNRFLTEERKIVFRTSAYARSIDVEQTFTAADGDVVFGDRKDAGLAIRVPASMAMKSNQGGVVINSDGLAIKEAWGKPAKWCDYHGTVDGEHLGIAFLNHPSSYRYPTRWHVREYGLFAANPFGLKSLDSKLGDGKTILKRGEQLKLKHRLIFHVGDPESAKIEEAWQQYAEEGKSDGSKQTK